MNAKELCFELAAADGTSGDEAAACAVCEKYLSKFMTVKTDTTGSLVGTLGNGNFKILLDAHIDRIGLVVREIDEQGFLLVSGVGGIDARVLVGAEVTVMGKEPLRGVICSTPPHLLTSEDKEKGVEVKNLAVDIGFSKEKAEKVVSVGDRILVSSKPLSLLDGKISCAALDNRSGAAALVLAAQKVSGRLKNCSLALQFSAQEEVGGSGAKTAAYTADSDVAIVVDVGFGSDAYCDKTETNTLSKGPSIGISPTLDRVLGKELSCIAKDNCIPFQHDVMSGRTGTNADQINISRGGVKTALLSIPLRYMHTQVEVIDTKDVEYTADLIAAYILKKEAELDA